MLNNSKVKMQKSKLQCKIKNYLYAFLILLGFPFISFAQLPAAGPTSWGGLAASIINFLLSLVIPVAVIMIIWSGILFMTAGGIEDRVTQAKKYFTWAIVGLAIALIGKGFISLVRDILGGV
jgi:hypothetical protein